MNRILNDAQFYNLFEFIEGKKIKKLTESLEHSDFIIELLTTIKNYLRRNKKGYAFPDDVDVHLTDGNLFKPDLVVVTKENAAILKQGKAIYGAPDMVVEVLSRSTKKRDVTVKKDAYEKNGVKEYWIVNPKYKSVDVYILRDGKNLRQGFKS